jgi:hypothetical protein
MTGYPFSATFKVSISDKVSVTPIIWLSHKIDYDRLEQTQTDGFTPPQYLSAA